jgi:hypothetical protein
VVEGYGVEQGGTSMLESDSLCNSVHLPMPELSFQNDAHTCDRVSSFSSTVLAICLPCYFSSLTSSTSTVSTRII